MEMLQLTLKLEHGLLIGGQTPAMLVNIATAREASGAPIITASALKGALRIECERLLAALQRGMGPAQFQGSPVCHPDNAGSACKPNELCPVCRLFGTPGKEGRLRFSDATLGSGPEGARRWFTKVEPGKDRTEKPTGRGYAIRYGVAVNRFRKTAEEKLLFSSEILAPLPGPADGYSVPPLTFTADVTVSDSLTDEEWELLQLCAQCLNAVGAGKSRGLGYVRAELRRLPSPVPVDPPRHADIPKSVMRVALTPLEYVRVSGIRAAGNFLETLDYLPGSTVRGAVAASFASMQEGGWQDEVVRKALLRNPVRFSNFYPSVIETNLPPKPIPLSARTCKACPGFDVHAGAGGLEDETESHGSRDTLVAATVVKLLREIKIPAVLDDRCTHQVGDGESCGSVLKGLDGFYRLADRGGQVCGSMPRRLTTKTAINRARFTSSEEQLYSYEIMDTRLEAPEHSSGGIAGVGVSRLRFVGTISNLTGALSRYLERRPTLYIGGARSRGFGKVRLEVLGEAPDEKESILRERLFDFTGKIRTALRATGHPRKGRIFFSLTCISDLMLPPIPTTGGDLEWLRETVESGLKLAGMELRIEKSIARSDCRSGFNEAIGMQKDLKNILVRGSSFVFSCEAEKTEVSKEESGKKNKGRKDKGKKETAKRDAESIILEKLPAFLRKGIGEQREEGYGRLSFCDELHLKRMERK